MNDFESLWDRALSVEGMSLEQSVITDYATYFKLTEQQARDEIFDDAYNARMLEEWQKIDPTDKQKAVVELFGSGRAFIKTNLLSCVRRYLLPHRGLATTFFPKSGNFTLLEFGGGSGNSAIFYARAFPAVVHLADISSQLLEFAQWRASRRETTIVSINLVEQSPPINTFDVITCFAVFEQIENPGEACNKLVRSLRPNGKLIISVTYMADDRQKPWNLSTFPAFLFELESIHHLRKTHWIDDGSQIFAVFDNETNYRPTLLDRIRSLFQRLAIFYRWQKLRLRG